MSKNEIKSKMPMPERLARRKQLQEAVAYDYAKTEQVNFRIDEKSIRELMAVASEKGRPLGTLIREWVLERLVQEKAGKPELKGQAMVVLKEIFEKLQDLYGVGTSTSVRKAQRRL
jgi:predicted DNA binding CopG/RHH family protein